MRVRALALASEAIAEASAREILESGGGALGAVLAGYFAAAGASSGVLFGPMSVLVAGVGAGARAFDGRMRQPGLGLKRPRGFLESDAIPEAARVASPTALTAAVVAHAYGAGATLRAVIRPGIDAAERAGAAQRAALLERVAQVGAAALAEPLYRRPLLRVGAAAEGGLVTPRDLDPAEGVDVPALDEPDGAERWVVAPWARLGAVSASAESGRGQGLVAVDAHGVFAALSYRSADAGVWVEEHELLVPAAAVPVRRGVPRLAPGARLPAPAPVAIRLDDALRPREVWAAPAARELDPAVSAERLVLARDPATRRVERKP